MAIFNSKLLVYQRVIKLKQATGSNDTPTVSSPWLKSAPTLTYRTELGHVWVTKIVPSGYVKIAIENDHL
jgi:hypothetical protein